MKELQGVRIHITGVVQGVGFRPFVYSLAKELALTGWVRNTSAGVDIELDGPPEVIEDFISALRTDAPPLARIDSIQSDVMPPNGFEEFEIIHSKSLTGAFQPISPDMTVCPDCERELFDPNDRRYRYPFINCTNCGPRFTIIDDIPYDRPKTTMAPFEMCQDCAREYEDPLDRRFHAQPVACPVCGPHIWLEVNGNSSIEGDDAIQAVRDLLRSGKVIAVKGLGGFHLACDATNPEAVAELRRRKLRVDKPFALMMPDLDAVEEHCITERAGEALLLSRERPIVIMERHRDSMIADAVAPNQNTLGVMLPYTPLHLLLVERESDFTEALVMTSGNLSEEPIATSNEEARERLAGMADAFLMHNRRIRTRCDDSVVRDYEGEVYPLRRARGYAPFPVRLSQDLPSLLATGAELKNTFCITRDEYAFISHHIGDMENYETLQAFEDGVTHYEKLFRVEIEALAHDLHPDYLATRYALKRAEYDGLPAVGVQHHHAHIASCMAENGLDGKEPVIGVSFDGTGYGEDGAIWGGEFLVANFNGYERPCHLAYIPLPGGDAAVRQPWRIALSWLAHAGVNWEADLPPVMNTDPESRQMIRRMIDLGLNSPSTSSMGRLFDAISALIGVRQSVNYEAQAAIELEALVEPEESGAYTFDIDDGIVDPASAIREIVKDHRDGWSSGVIAARFHNGLAATVSRVCLILRDRYGINRAVLSGGVWQNMVLLSQTIRHLRENEFEVFIHRKVPTNDGGLALGQAVIAMTKLNQGQEPFREFMQQERR
ncbi:MAG: carbamoyltransferase HypF [Anaerolineales bacterium]|nr:carbamoyltransferase HypF [Anaerolineales bacterium]